LVLYYRNDVCASATRHRCGGAALLRQGQKVSRSGLRAPRPSRAQPGCRCWRGGEEDRHGATRRSLHGPLPGTIMAAPLVSLGRMVATPAVLMLLDPTFEVSWTDFARMNLLQPCCNQVHSGQKAADNPSSANPRKSCKSADLVGTTERVRTNECDWKSRKRC
jgi:hypothetical protein